MWGSCFGAEDVGNSAERKVLFMQIKFKILFEKLWQHRREFFKYFVVGITAFILDTGSLYVLKEKLHVTPTVALAVSQPFILAFVFFINRNWSFDIKSGREESTKQLIKFLSLAIGNYLFGLVWMWAIHDILGIHYMITRVANIILSVGWNFLLYKYWVYKTKPVHNNPILTP